jgi:hypothetical protein
MRIPEQVQRLGVVIGVLVAVVIVARFFLIPPSLVARELHRTAAVEREIAKTPKFAGTDACRGCHEDVANTKDRGYHRALACEGCHGAALKHADDPGATKPTVNRDRKLCPACHAYDEARPTGFPQINPVSHNPVKPCVTCHSPHDPAPPVVPTECSACHAQIERTKAVSSHALLACTTCHTAPEQHKKTPRTARPTKPQTREFCGTCHASGAKGAPRVDLATHGGRERCWQCHYPHMPEGRG